MRVKSIEKIYFDEPIRLYDISQTEESNFIIEGKEKDYIVHNCGIMDEINFSQAKKSLKLEQDAMMRTYDAVKQRMKSRFIGRGGELPTVLFMMSSKRAESDFLERYIQTVKKESSTYVVDEPIWKVKPSDNYSGKTFKVAVGDKYKPSKVIGKDETIESYERLGYNIIDVPVEYQEDFERSIETALMNIAGISVFGSMKFLSSARVSNVIIDRENPFTLEEIITGIDDDNQIWDYFKPEEVDKELYTKPIYIHIDTSVSGDRTGIAAVAIIGAKEKENQAAEAVPDTDLYYEQLFGVTIKAPTDSEIDFEKSRKFIYYLKRLGWNIKAVSTDGFQSVDTRQQLEKQGVKSDLISLDRKPDGYMSLRAAISEQRVGLLNINIQREELIHLERDMRTGKVDHPSEGSKDLADALTGALYNASLSKDEYLYHYGSDIEIIYDFNTKGGGTDKHALLKELEDMLKEDAKVQENAKKVLKRAEEKRLVDFSNMTDQERKEYNESLLSKNVYKPSVLNNDIFIF